MIFLVWFSLIISCFHLFCFFLIIFHLVPKDAISNVHGTAFGGSIFTACLLSGWSLVSALLPHHSVVAQTVTVDFKRPVTGPFLYCRALIAEDTENKLEDVLKIRETHTKAKVYLTVHSYSSDKPDSLDPSLPPQVVFNAKYHCAPIEEKKEENVKGEEKKES